MCSREVNIMNDEIQNKLEKKITELKQFIGHFETESVLGMIGNDLCLLYDGKNFFNDIKLSSPYKQYMYLAGLIISTNEVNCRSLEEKDFNKAKKLLEEVCNLYALNFFPTKEEIESKSLGGSWYEARKVSMPVFLDYFNTTILNYEEQEEKRLVRWFEPFNEYFKSKYKFTVTDLLNIYRYIVNNLRSSLKEIRHYRDIIEVSRDSWYQSVENGLSFEDASNILDKEEIQDAYYKMMNKVINLNKIYIKDLDDEFGSEKIKSFIDIFSIERKEREYRYYTDKNPYEEKPLFRKSNEYIFCAVYKQLLNAIFDFLYKELEKSKKSQKFYINRDKEAEKEAEEIIKNIFGEEGKYFTSVFETNDSHNEHDLFVIYKDILIIGEVKAAKVKEPFRNPEKAYIRIKGDFKSDKGIQKAYNQGLNLKKLILSQENTTLYNKQGDALINIKRDNYKKIYIFCITAENYSILATQLSLLLEKPQEEVYPWAVNLYDLDNICNAFKFKKLSPDKFLKYIDDRIELHEKLFSTDELEICGFYLREGNFNKIKKIVSKNSIMFFTASMSEIFDEIYYEQKGIKINPNDYNLSIMSMTDMLYNINKKNSSRVEKNNKNNKTKKNMIKKSRKKNRRKK